MADQVLTILKRLRRRLVATRALEDAAAGAVVGGFAAAAVMAGCILAGRYRVASAVLCALPLVGGAILAAWPGLAGRLGCVGPLRWVLAGVLLGGGGAGTGAALAAPAVKNWLVLIAPVAAGLAAVVRVLRGASLQSVAVRVDLAAATAERLSTALELRASQAETAFARAVGEQAARLAESDRLRRLRFATGWRRRLGGAGLALAACVLMLPWEPLQPAEASLARRWEQGARQAGEILRQPMAATEIARLAASGRLRAALERLADLSVALRAARPEDAARWKGKVVELEQVAAALRRALASETMDARTRARLERLLLAVEAAGLRIAEAMGEPTSMQRALLAGGEGPAYEPGRHLRMPESAPAGWTSVYNPRYAELASAPFTTGPARAMPGVSTAEVPYDEAWANARRRAARDLARRTVPARYRDLVRRYFAAKP